MRLSEAIHINLGLLALQVVLASPPQAACTSNSINPATTIIIISVVSYITPLQSCIAALADKSRHPPFNDRLLPPNPTSNANRTQPPSPSRLTSLLGPCLSNAAREGGPVIFIVQARTPLPPKKPL